MSALPSGATGALLEIFIFLAGAEAIRYRLRDFGVPQILGEILFGMALAPAALGGVLNGILGTNLFVVTPVLLAFSDFSVILLIFAAGLEGGFSSLRRAGGWAIAAAVAGNLLPFAAGFLVFAHLFGPSVALLLAVAASSTSTAVVVSLIRSEGLGGSSGGQFLLATCAMDDIVGLVLLSTILGLLGGRMTFVAITGSVAVSVAIWVVVLLASVAVIPRVFRALGPRGTFNLPFLILFILAAVVTAVGFSTIAGAYIAGLAIAESVAAGRTRATADVLLAVFGALFFVVIGFQFDVSRLADPIVIEAGLLLALIAASGKLAAIFPLASARFPRHPDATMIALGMVPRGEIGLIVGAIGISLGILTQQALGAILVMTLVTVALGSVLFRRVAAHARDNYLRGTGTTRPSPTEGPGPPGADGG